MKEKDLKKIKVLVIVIKIALALLILYPLTQGFKAGWDAYDGKEYPFYSLDQNLLNAEPLKDSLLATSGNYKIIGVRTFILKPISGKVFTDAKIAGSPWLKLISGLLVLAMIAAFVFMVKTFMQVYRLLSNLQHLRLFDSQNPIVLRKMVKYGLLYIIVSIVYYKFQIFEIAKQINIKGYKIEYFTLCAVDFFFILAALVLLLVSYMWDHAIALKSENDLTV